MSALIAIVVAVILIGCNMPIGISFLAGDFVAIGTVSGAGTLAFAPASVLNSLQNLTFLAVPMFILASDLLLGSGIGDGLIRLLVAATRGRTRFSPIAAVAAAVFFGGISGSSVAEAAALGRLIYPLMRSQGFSAGRVAGLVATSATVGVLLPPSIPLIVYSGVTQTPVTELFHAALWPGVVTALVLAVLGLVLVRPSQTQDARPADPGDVDTDPEEIPLKFATATGKYRRRIAPIYALAAPVIAIGGIYSGLVTPTEAGAVLVAYGILSAFVFQTRQCAKVISTAVRSALSTSASVFLILAAALLFSQIAIEDQIPQTLASDVSNAGLPAKLFLLVLAAIVIVFGILFEGLGMLLVMAPIVTTIASSLHLSLVYFGVFLVVCIEISVVTPPLGVNLLTVSSVTGLSSSQVSRSVWRFYAVPVLLLLAVIAVPALVS
jgi:C4-dicarboxylate transporter, DctM subunit